MAFEGWENGVPPRHWKRVLSYDVGGATANALNWAAICPDTQSLVFHDEVHKVTTDIRLVAELALPKMKPEGADHEYDFLAKIGDYENKVALDDMSRYGIKFTNAVKHDKLISVGRFAGYLHPNPKRPFPSWHPRAGQLGAPLVYITSRCPHLIAEIPQQRWKTGTAVGSGDSVKDELDRTVKHDHVDCALYIVRLLPAPATIKIPKITTVVNPKSLQSILYYADLKKQQEKVSASGPRKPYNPSHYGGNDQWKSSLLDFS